MKITPFVLGRRVSIRPDFSVMPVFGVFNLAAHPFGQRFPYPFPAGLISSPNSVKTGTVRSSIGFSGT
jgi:hypothetical protein